MAFVGLLPQIPSTGARLGGAIGTGLTSGLQNLAQNKLNEIQKRQQISGLEALLPGAGQILNLPQELQETAFKQLLQAPQNQAYFSALQQLQQGQQPEEVNPLEQNAPTQKIAAPTQKTAIAPEKNKISGLLQQAGLNERQATKLTELALKEQGKQTQKELAKEKIAIQQQQFKSKQAVEKQKTIDKETLPFYNETLDKVKGALESDQNLDRMQELINTGKLENPFLLGLFQRYSPKHYKALLNPESSEFNKLSKNYLKNAKSIFGNRVSNFEASTFLDMVPDLLQSDEGKQRILNLMRIQNQAEIIRSQAMEKIIQENGGERPRDLRPKVEKEAKAQLDRLASAFKNGVNIAKQNELPDIKDYKNGDVITNDETGETKKLVSGKWESI